MKYPLALITAFITGLAAHAEVRLPNFFGDHMVLQQQTSNAVWGVRFPRRAHHRRGQLGRAEHRHHRPRG